MKKDLDIKSCKFVEISSIVPKEWTGWFYTEISENAPFSYGDNNRTMVDAVSLRNHINDVFDVFQNESEENREDIEKEIDAFFDVLGYLESKNIYVDLEN
jgi:hypothetical protein